MPELLLGLLVGTVLAARAGLGGSGALLVAGTVAALLYLASCFVWPYRACWRCSSDDRAGDGRGNYRRRRCWWCKSVRDNPRVGAQLIGRARR